MSGFVAMVRSEVPVDAGLLERMTEFMAFRGPDARNTWTQGSVGLGHAQLKTTWEDAEDRQPSTLDGKRWLAADARIDGRRDLLAALRSQGRAIEEGCPDSHLILAAYAVWGEKCAEHLFGDFAFVIWDAETKTLFGARDHFGIKPFYYAEAPGVFLVSNTLHCLCQHPAVSREVDELVVGDYLVAGANHHVSRTIFRDVHSLPPGHALCQTGGKIRLRQYWQFPVEEPLKYRREEEYEEQLREIFAEAVKDRLRADRVSISFSGGMDSTSIAALAKQAGQQSARGTQLHAYSVGYRHRIPDQEPQFAKLAADALGLPLDFLWADDYVPMGGAEEGAGTSPVPTYLFAARNRDFNRLANGFSRVILTGMGGDPVFFVTKVFDVRPLTRLFGCLPGLLTVLKEGGRPPLGLKTRLQSRWEDSQEWRCPAYLRADFAAQTGLAKRYRELAGYPLGPHPTRPLAHGILASSHWSGSAMAEYDAEQTGLPLEYRHPLLDVRLIRFLLRVPPWPHFYHKRILRRAMKGLLPEEIRLRPKTPLRSWRFATFLEHDPEPVKKELAGLSALDRWVDASLLRDSILRDLARLPDLNPAENADLEHTVGLVALANWLK